MRRCSNMAGCLSAGGRASGRRNSQPITTVGLMVSQYFLTRSACASAWRVLLSGARVRGSGVDRRDACVPCAGMCGPDSSSQAPGVRASFRQVVRQDERDSPTSLRRDTDCRRRCPGACPLCADNVHYVKLRLRGLSPGTESPFPHVLSQFSWPNLIDIAVQPGDHLAGLRTLQLRLLDEWRRYSLRDVETLLDQTPVPDIWAHYLAYGA